VTVTAIAPGSVANNAVVSPTDDTPGDNTSSVVTNIQQVLAVTITPAAELPHTGANTSGHVDGALLLLGTGLVLLGFGVTRKRPEED